MFFFILIALKSIIISKNTYIFFLFEFEGESKFYDYIKFLNGTIRDIICVCVLIIIDTLILIEFRNVIKRKKRILSSSSSNSKSSINNNRNNKNNGSNKSNNNRSNGDNSSYSTTTGISRVELAERRLTEMILVKSAVRIFGHMPYFLKYIPSVEMSSCVREAFSVLFIASDMVNFFIYYAYNRVFRAYLNSYVCPSPSRRHQRASLMKKSSTRRNRNKNRRAALQQRGVDLPNEIPPAVVTDAADIVHHPSLNDTNTYHLVRL